MPSKPLDSVNGAEAERPQNVTKITEAKAEKSQLTELEREIIRLVAPGYKNKEIAETLLRTEQTVKKHLHKIFDKLGVSDRLELALVAIAKKKGPSVQHASEREPSPEVELIMKGLELAGSPERLIRWMRTPVPSLNGQPPYSLMGTEEGRKQVEASLIRIEHGVY